MSASISERQTTADAGRPFFLVMSLLLAGIAVFGFSHTVPGDLAAPDFPVLLWVHAAVFTAWVLLFVCQPALVMRGSLHLHRRLGWSGAALACAMVAMGTGAILFALWNDTLPPFYPHGLFLVRGILGLLVFAGLVTAGVLLRRRSGWHKRLMLCASIVIIVPGLERAMPIPLFGTVWPYVVDGVVDLIAASGPVMDLIQRGRIHPAYLWGVGAIVLGQATVDLLAPTHLTTLLLHALGTG